MGVGFGERAGIELDAIGAAVARARDRSIPISIVSRIGEQADPATQGFELRNQRRERGDVVVEIETVIGGELVVAIGYQCGLRRAHGFAQGDGRTASHRAMKPG